MHKFLLTLLSVLLFYYSNAQTEIDALRYSNQNIIGTARFSAMAGAYGSLGADFTTLSYNPAGIGFYQFSELSITPSITNIIATSFYGGERAIDEKFNSNFSNFGYVVSSPKTYLLDKSGNEWKRLNFAFGWNKTANYHKQTYIRGNNSNSSMIDNFVSNAQGNNIDKLNSFTELLAWNTYLFNPIDTIDNGNYISNLNSLLNKSQEKLISSNGSSGEYVFSVGTSYEDRIYLGATIAMPSIDYYEISTYIESEFEDTAAHLEYFEYKEELSTIGKGLNIKLGAIVRLNDWIKVGGALHSPTYYDMEDEYSTAINAVWNDSLGIKYYSSPFGYFNYELRTPWKAIASFGLNIKKQGLLTADIEMIDYTSVKLNSDSYRFADENDVINSLYTKTTNIRLGAEIKYKLFRFRTGYAHYASPYKDNSEMTNESLSFGLGIDRGYFIFDFAYVFSEGSDNHYMYSPDLVKPANITSTVHNFLITLGLRY